MSQNSCLMPPPRVVHACQELAVRLVIILAGHDTQRHSIRHRFFLGAIIKKILGSMSSSHMPSRADTFAPGNSLKNRATASLSSSLARWTPRHTADSQSVRPAVQ